MPGKIVHIEIPADDTAKSREFWGSLFGWEFEAYPGPSEYFDVDDINDGAAKVRELGGKADDPMPVPSMGWFATCTDPHGNEFGLWQNDESAPMPTGS
jgi:uncharacterized protein